MMKGEHGVFPFPLYRFLSVDPIYAQNNCETQRNERWICRVMVELHVCTLAPSVRQMSRVWIEKSLFKHMTIQYAATSRPFDTTMTAAVQRIVSCSMYYIIYVFINNSYVPTSNSRMTVSQFPLPTAHCVWAVIHRSASRLTAEG